MLLIPMLAQLRQWPDLENSNAIDPIQVYRSLNYKQTKSKIRVTNKGSSSGIV